MAIPVDTQDLHELTRPDVLGVAIANAMGDERWLAFSTRLLAGGRSNLTFELTSPAGQLVLRRPPTGDVPPGAHDMGREIRVQRALANSHVPVPKIVLGDFAGDLLGVPSYVMEKVAGHVVTDSNSGLVAACDRSRLAAGLTDVLSNLHAIDPAAVGLNDFGRPDGYVERQVRRWIGQWEMSFGTHMPEVAKLGDLLLECMPTARPAAILHGDFRLDNCLMAVDDPARVAAVLDWEMSTLGDPRADLGMFLFYWREQGDFEHPLLPRISALPGFPSRSELVERYGSAIISQDEVRYFLALANFKSAVVARGIANRAERGSMAGQQFGNLDGLVMACAAAGLAALD